MATIPAAAAAAASSHPPSKTLTLVVAATASTFAIGRQGSLPWRLKSDLSFFARITKRVPASSSSSGPQQQRRCRNAVIMGRKTYLSIPPRFRPLPDRINVVLSRSHSSNSNDEQYPPGVIRAGSIEDALAQLSNHRHQTVGGEEEAGEEEVGKIFVIGGAEIYKAALESGRVRDVVLTRIENEVDGCDVFFPLRLEEGERKEEGWRKMGHEELESVAGEEVPRGVQQEGDWRFEFQLWRCD